MSGFSGHRRRTYTRKPATPEQVIEYPSIGSTYHRDEYGVYEYGEYPRSSVLSGQTRRVWLDSFETLEEAKAAYPAASFTAPQFQPPSLDHLPDNEDGDLEQYEREALAREAGR